MSTRRISFKPNNTVTPCPKCGNNTVFDIHSEQCAEDCCDIWATCKCGYNPTSERHLDRIEDTWGSLNDDMCKGAVLYTWNEIIELNQPLNHGR